MTVPEEVPVTITSSDTMTGGSESNDEEEHKR